LGVQGGNQSMTTLKKFRTKFGRDIFNQKYRHQLANSWGELAHTLAYSVCGGLLPGGVIKEIFYAITTKKFIPAGRYLYYAGRAVPYYNNCFSMKVEDTREGWSELVKNVTSALMIGGGVGVDYSALRPEGALLKRTGGTASGPIPLMMMLNEIGRNVQQGGSRRSALWAGLNWRHKDINKFIHLKDWPLWLQEQKALDYNVPAPMDMTNISVLFDDEWLVPPLTPDHVFNEVVRQMCQTGEPGMCFNFGEQSDETLRNACCEFISDEDSDMCNLGSLNLAAINSIEELKRFIYLASQFLVCGSVRAELPYEKCRDVRDRKRKIGLGLMGVHEWLLKRGERYEVTPELHEWLAVYRDVSTEAANQCADNLSISRPIRYRAIAPAGTISIMAGTTSGIEPLFATAVKRRYLVGGSNWKEQYFVDPTAKVISQELGIDPDSIETAYDLAADPERRIKFQADVQDYVDMGISSTINLPEWGSDLNNEDTVAKLGRIIMRYSGRLRGITTYPNNARAGQTLTAVPFKEAEALEGQVFDASEFQCKGGVCGI